MNKQRLFNGWQRFGEVKAKFHCAILVRELASYPASELVTDILASRGACTTGAAGAAAPLALVVRGRTGAEKCPLLQYKVYCTSKEQV